MGSFVKMKIFLCYFFFLNKWKFNQFTHINYFIF